MYQNILVTLTHTRNILKITKYTNAHIMFAIQFDFRTTPILSIERTTELKQSHSSAPRYDIKIECLQIFIISQVHYEMI